MTDSRNRCATSKLVFSLGFVLMLLSLHAFRAADARAQAAPRPSIEGLQQQVTALGNVYEVDYPRTVESHPTLELSSSIPIYCQVGDVAIGGGYWLPNNDFAYQIVGSRRATDPRGWVISILVAPAAPTLSFTVYTYCLDLTP